MLLKKFACEILHTKVTFFGLILPFPVKMFGFDPDGHEELLKNFKLENSLTIYQVYVLQKDNCIPQHEKGHTQKQDEHWSKLSGDQEFKVWQWKC